MTRTLSRFFALAAFLISLVGTVKAGAIIDGDGNDMLVDQNAAPDTSYNVVYQINVGPLYNANGNMVEAFQLPYLAPGQQVTGATISFYLEAKNGTPPSNVQLYGLKRVSATSPLPLLSDWYAGPNDTANTLLDATFTTPSAAVNQAYTYSGSNLATFIQGQYTNSAFSGLDLSNSRYIFFRLSPDSVQDPGWDNYQFASAREPNRSYHPTLSLTISNGITNVAGRLQFSFNLPQSSDTSAGVYNTATGALIRTLWNNVQYQQGTNYGVWDGKDDNGNVVATGSNYQIKLIYHNVQYVWDGLVGNTSASQSGSQMYRSFGKILDMSIGGGNAYYAVGYNELQNPYHSFVLGTPQVPYEVPGKVGVNFADCYSVMDYVATDGTLTYWAKTPGGITPLDTYVIATVNSTGLFYNFPQGTTPTGSNQQYSSCTDFDATANQANPPTGLAVQKSGNYLFVSHGNLNVVRVFDKVAGNLLGSFSVTNPGRMATTANGDVWVVSNTSVMRYTFANGSATLDRTISGFSNPAGLGVSADDSLLLVADGGSSQQVKAYNNSTGTAAWTYGALGGMDVNGPTVSTSTFEFNTQDSNYNTFTNNSFITFQPDNTFWIGDGGNGRVLHYSISGSTLTYIEQIAFDDVAYKAAVDLANPTHVFNAFKEYSVNYALPLAGTNGSWTMTKNWAIGLPNDSTHLYFGFANGFINVVTLSNGHTYGFLNNFITNNEDLFELPATGPARNTGYTFSNNARIYADGTLRYNMVNGSTSISYYSAPLTGFDAKNNPSWGTPALLASTTLASGDPIPWGTFPLRTETTASGMVVDFDGNQADNGFHIGATKIGGTSLLWRSGASTSSTNTLWFPQDGHFDIGNGTQYAGNYAMALDRNIIYGYNGEFWKNGEASQWVNYLDNGLMVGRFGTYGNPAITTGGTNGFAGNSFSASLVHAPDGNTYFYHNDESNHSATVRWRINGWAGITEMNATSSIGSTVSLNTSTAGPTVAITSPTAGAEYFNGNSITLNADAESSGASIISVQFFDGSTSLGTVSAAPFTLNYTGMSAGSHVITAVATDSSGLSTTSAPVSITVGADGTTAPPPAPISLTSGTMTSSSVPLSWTEPTVGSTSSAIGRILSFQFDSSGDSHALSSSMVAGAPSYAVGHFNQLGTSATNGVSFITAVDSTGTTVPNLGLNAQIVLSNDIGYYPSLPGTAQNLFVSEVTTAYNTTNAISVSNVPYALYDLVVYSQPGSASSISVTVSNGASSSTVTQNFSSAPTGYTVSSVAFGSNGTATNANTIVIQGVNSANFKLAGSNIAGFQIVERPYDQGTPTSFIIQRALGTSGSFTTVGTVSGTTLSYTDSSNLVAGSSYQYRVQATNSYGSSAYSNILSVTPSTGATSSTGSGSGSTGSGSSGSGSGSGSTGTTVSAPVISSSTSASGTVGSAFSYAITASNTPTSYGASGVPSGLSVNTATGVISGMPTASGTFAVTITATNSGGTASGILTLTINALVPSAPVISSSSTASGTVGSTFGYSITASNSPTSFGATGLPAGLSVNTSTGVISGTPTTAGVFYVTISASNSGGTGTLTSIMTIKALAPVITSSAAASGTVGTAFSYTITATNSPTSYSATGLPSGLSINTSTGVISGTPTATGTSSVTIGATNSGGTVTQALTLTIKAAATVAPVITSSSAASGTVGTAFSYTITATNSPTSYSASGLPSGLSINTSTGLISGTPTASGTSSVTIGATNAGGTGTQSLGLTINAATPAVPVITSSLAANGTVGVAFSYVITATNSPTSYSATGLPAGLSINTASGLISGTPTATGTSLVTIKATNATGTASATLSLTISTTVVIAPVITSSTVIGANTGTAFGYNIVALNNPTSFNATGLPAGLTVNTGTGVISGTPTVAGTFSVVLSATNSAGTATVTLVMTITDPVTGAPVITSPLTATATLGAPYSYSITGTNSPTNYGARGVPAGLSVNTNSGIISGTPTATGTFLVSIIAGNAYGTTYATLALTINASSSAPTITSSTTATGTVGTAFNYAIAATNSPTSYGAAGLPAGLSVNASTGLISGTPTSAGTSSVTLSATNAAGTATQTLTLMISSSVPSAPAISSSTSASGTVGSAFNYSITASNSPTGYNATGLPAGLSVNAGTGVISGTPTTVGVFYVTLSASNSGGTGTQALSLTINALMPVISSSASASGTVGTAFTYTITASNSPTSFGATGLPAGLSVNTSTGVISGTPTSSGTTSVSLSATNSGGTDTQTLTLTISAAVPSAPVITSGTTASGTVGAAFSYAITATNTPTSFSATGLPAGLSVNTSTGVISGTPTSAGSSSAKIIANNAGGTGAQTLSITIGSGSSSQAPVITSASSASGTVGVAFNYAITASNSPTSFGATGVPAGLSVNMQSGLISGTPTSAGQSTINIMATNSAGTSSGTLTLTISSSAPTAPVINSGATASGTVGSAFSYSITASNNPTSFNASGLPAGLSINTSNGVISGTPTSAGTSLVMLSASNANGTGTQALALTIAAAPTSPTPTAGFAAWQALYFTTAQLADPTISGPTADPYGSGVPNLLAYALQLNPSTARTTDVPAATPVNGYLTITYFVPSTITDVSYVVEVSSDLVTWNSGTGYTQVISNVAGGGGNTITVQDTISGATQNRFMRLTVTPIQ